MYAKILCQKLNLDFECDAPVKFLSSQWQHREKSFTYMIYRLLIATFFNFSFINALIFSIEKNQLFVSFIYLTRLNLLATAIACNIGAYYVIAYNSGWIKSIDRMTLGLKIYWFMYTNILPIACVISVVYWTLLYDPKLHGLNLNNVLVHMTNSLVLLIDLFIIRHDCRIKHVIYPVICGGLYLLFTIIYPLLGGVDEYGFNYVYPILNWMERPLSALITGTSTISALALLHAFFCGIKYCKQMTYDFYFSDIKSSV